MTKITSIVLFATSAAAEEEKPFFEPARELESSAASGDKQCNRFGKDRTYNPKGSHQINPMVPKGKVVCDARGQQWICNGNTGKFDRDGSCGTPTPPTQDGC